MRFVMRALCVAAVAGMATAAFAQEAKPDRPRQRQRDQVRELEPPRDGVRREQGGWGQPQDCPLPQAGEGAPLQDTGDRFRDRVRDRRDPLAPDALAGARPRLGPGGGFGPPQEFQPGPGFGRAQSFGRGQGRGSGQGFGQGGGFGPGQGRWQAPDSGWGQETQIPRGAGRGQMAPGARGQMPRGRGGVQGPDRVLGRQALRGQPWQRPGGGRGQFAPGVEQGGGRDLLRERWRQLPPERRQEMIDRIRERLDRAEAALREQEGAGPGSRGGRDVPGPGLGAGPLPEDIRGRAQEFRQRRMQEWPQPQPQRAQPRGPGRGGQRI